MSETSSEAYTNFLLRRLANVVPVLIRSSSILIRTALIILIPKATSAVVLLIATTTTSTISTLLVAVAFVHLGTTRLGLHILFDQVDDFIGNSKVFNGAAADVTFVHAPELVSVLKFRK